MTSNLIRSYLIHGYHVPNSLREEKYILALFLPTSPKEGGGGYSQTIAKEYRCNNQAFFHEELDHNWGAVSIGDDLSGVLPRHVVEEFEEIIKQGYRYKAKTFDTEEDLYEAKGIVQNSLKKILVANTHPCDTLFNLSIDPN